jgi:porin
MLEKVFKYQADSVTELISGFFRIGKTEGDTTQFDLALSAGLVFKGAFPGRALDELGLAYASERNSEKYRLASGNPVQYEKSYELGYRYRATAGLVIQPFVQYLQNHGADMSQDRTWWLGVRMNALL